MPVIVNGTGYVQLPVGTTSDRPTTPVAGMIRFNTTTGIQFAEVYTGYSWVKLPGGPV